MYYVRNMMHTTLPTRSEQTRGFTLIELLVVIALLAALAAVAYPSYLKYSQNSERTVCTSNLNELKHLGTQYSSDHYGILPCSGMQDDPDTVEYDESQGWWVALGPYVFKGESEYAPNSAKDDPKYRSTFRCPSDKRQAKYKPDEFIGANPETVSYASWTDNSADPDDPGSCIQTSRGQLLSGIPWLSDGTAQRDASIRTAADFEEFILPIAERHNGYTCVLYADMAIRSIEDPTFHSVAPGLENKEKK